MFFNFCKKNFVQLIAVAVGFISTVLLMQAASAADIGGIASNVTSTMKSVGQLLAAGAYVAGFGLTIAALFKFKAHKENPTQEKLATPIVLLAIGVALIFLPSVITTGGATVFGGTRSIGGFSGTGITGSSF